MCIKKCFLDYNSELEQEEKICLAKCLDRAYDYMQLEKNILNPYLKVTNPI